MVAVEIDLFLWSKPLRLTRLHRQEKEIWPCLPYQSGFKAATTFQTFRERYEKLIPRLLLMAREGARGKRHKRRKSGGETEMHLQQAAGGESEGGVQLDLLGDGISSHSQDALGLPVTASGDASRHSSSLTELDDGAETSCNREEMIVIDDSDEEEEADEEKEADGDSDSDGVTDSNLYLRDTTRSERHKWRWRRRRRIIVDPDSASDSDP